MDENEFKKLEKNLTRSAKKARLYWIRGMVGLLESDQGFFPLEAIPVSNPIKGKETTMAELIQDCGKLNDEHKKLKASHDTLVKELSDYKQAQIDLQNQNVIKSEELARRIAAIEAFKID